MLLTSSAVLLLLASSAPPARPSVDTRPLQAAESPVVIEWDLPAKGETQPGGGLIWAPHMVYGGEQMTQAEFEEAVEQVRATEAQTQDSQEYIVRAGDGGLAGGANITFILSSVPADVVVPVIAASQEVANYFSTVLLSTTNVTIKVQFQNIAGGAVAIAATRFSTQSVAPSLASLIDSGISGSHLDDARFLPNPPAPYGTGPAANARLRVFYSNLQANGKNRSTSENQVVWTAANLRAAWIYALSGLSSVDGTITFTTAGGIFDNFDFDPADGVPPAGVSFQDWLVRLTAVNLGWISAIQTNMTGQSTVMDLYRFRSDIIPESTNGLPAALPTDFGYLTQEPSAFNSVFGGITCDDVSEALSVSINNGATFTDPLLGQFAPDYNPGGYLKFRNALATNSPFLTTEEQADFVASNFGTPLTGFSAYGTVVRNQFGGSGLTDDSQVIPPIPPALRTYYTDCNMPAYVTEQGFCFLIDYNPSYPGYYSRFVVRGVNLPAGEVVLNYVTGLNGSTTDDSATGVDLEVPLFDDTNAAAGFLEGNFVMGGAFIPTGTTFWPTFLSPTELKVIDCLGWDAPQP